MKKLVLVLLANVAALIAFTSTAFADDYDVPVIIFGETFTITISVEDSTVITATSQIPYVDIGPIIKTSGENVVTTTVKNSLTSTNAVAGNTTLPVSTSGSNSQEYEQSTEYAIYHNIPAFPKGDTGEVSVVQTGPYRNSFSYGYGTVVYRNNTDNAIGDLVVNGTLLDKDDEFVAAGDNTFGSVPRFLQPGKIAFAEIDFSNTEVMDGDVLSDITFEYESTPNMRMSFEPLIISEYSNSKRNKDVIVGVIANQNTYKVDNVRLDFLCYDTDTGGIKDRRAELVPDEIDPGGTLNFHVEAGCESFVMYASGMKVR